jgi:hypothetical protein
MNRNQFLSLFIILFIVSSCQQELFEEENGESFDKVYALYQNVEAVDFICKPDGSGYVILGNIIIENNSDIFLIDVNANGMQKNIHFIKTPFYDQAIKLKINLEDNSLLALGHRRDDNTQTNIKQNILFTSDINGVPKRADNISEEDSVAAEIKIINENENNPIKLNDMLIMPPNLIFVGQINQSSSGLYNRITQIYDFNSIDFSDTTETNLQLRQQKPVENSINWNNNQSLKIVTGNTSNAIYTVFGHNNRENIYGEVVGPSQNISWDIYTNLESSASLSTWIGTDQNEQLGDILIHSNGRTYISGYYSDAGNDSLFLITKEYREINSTFSETIYNFSGFGNITASLTEDEKGNIIMATVQEDELGSTGYLLKFSPRATSIESDKFKFESTGLYNIKKIESEPNNTVIVLSQKNFDNNSTAIGLMKIKF